MNQTKSNHSPINVFPDRLQEVLTFSVIFEIYASTILVVLCDLRVEIVDFHTCKVSDRL